MRHPIHSRRRGVAAVETALVLSVLLVLMCGMIAGGTGVFRQQQGQCLATEGARFASTRGGDYQKDVNGASPTAQQIVDQAITPKAVGINPADLSVTVQWIDKSTNTVWDWDSAPKDVRSITVTGEYISNAVRVTVRYQWAPGMFWAPTTIQTVSEVPMSN